MKINVPLLFDVMLHFGTLLAVIVFFWKDIIKILKSLFTFDFKSEEGKLIIFIIVGTIPAALTGLIFHDIIESFFSNLSVVGIALVITGVILLLTKKSQGKKELNIFDSFLIGIAQAFSLIPGISRSGTTISTGLLRGIDKEKALKFSFLLSIPAIIGANLLELVKNPITETDVLPLYVCVITSTIVGYLSLKVLYRIIKRGKFYYFAFYCFIIGLLLLIYSMG
jgi:undecaprenyl-diphosphatase